MRPEVQRHSATAQAAYIDLVSLLLDEAIAEIRGSPTPRERAGRIYWYDRYRIGTETHERYLGEDSPALRDRIDQHDALKSQRELRRRERARLVRLLRSERFLGMDNATGSLVGALAKAGVFRLGGVMVGTNAFRMYEGELAVHLRFDQTAMTNDIDIASFEKLSLALGETILPSMEEILTDFEFSPVTSLDKGKVWRWKQSRSQTLVEFLTPSFDAKEDLRELAALGVSAQSLHFLNYLIADPIHAAGVYRDGIPVHVPRPEKFAIHKLIVADRRRDGQDGLRARKDLMQVEFLLTILVEDRPTDLLVAYEDALSRGPAWRERIDRSLGRSRKSAELLESLK
ncbi:GSU2403 family nucleotidyltransferase fold protein [Mesorhizobium sp. VNQ89]|uniref:nucleotidyltransferase family protein n=1 Tax=Mesorhizobium quangtriensis TaxID=3157709 RepID=UPI0032B7126F